MGRDCVRCVGCGYAYVEAGPVVRPLALAVDAELALGTGVDHGSPAIAAVAGADVVVNAVVAGFVVLEDCSQASAVGLVFLEVAVVVFEVSALAELVFVALAPEPELEQEVCQHLSI